MGNRCLRKEQPRAENGAGHSNIIEYGPEGDESLSSVDTEPWIDAGIGQGTYMHIVTEFASLDKNGDHVLNQSEFLDGVGKLPEFLGMKKDDVQHLFTQVDMDKNELVSFNEFVRYMSKRKHHMPLPVQVEPQKKRLADNMELLGFEMCTTDKGMRGVSGDGNCQFYSLSWHIFGTTSKHGHVRRQVVENLSGPAKMQVSPFYCPEHPRDPATFDDWLKYMSKDKIWGNHFTLQAASDVYCLRIYVLEAGKWNPRKKLPEGTTAGHCFGVVNVLEPQQLQAPAKNVWISFAAQHYSPIQPTPKTPAIVLGSL
eukprot:TRINITY_DN37116_c0_g1_i1.p1 TRINITY_DN37116_c0_g1~~TRINITY_DN37116_c0_g1_i1.p1  ORF type:complete len:312 (+),score=52.38 TRINITY_DN37116_c0_g1_i1:85-1020(+)